MDKVEKDGKVAVVYSPGFGAGWSTWADDKHKETMCMDARIVEPVLRGNMQEAIAVAERICPDFFYAGGSVNLSIVWLNKGSVFEITEYDGFETVHVIGSRDYMVA